MSSVHHFISTVNGVVWGAPMLLAIIGVGLFLMFRLAWVPARKIGHGMHQLWLGRNSEGPGDISAFNALMTSLSATIGTGNIAGVATAIAIGGPGALFWMWITALVGMATKYAEAVCAVQYRETDAAGKQIGGPMYYIRNGLGKNWHWLAFLFALFGAVAAFGIGNMVQSNSIADALDDRFGISPFLSATLLVILVAVVLLGGITNIAAWASRLVPFMAVLYVSFGLLVLLYNSTEIPAALALITRSAFTGTAAAGGFAGATLIAAIQFGVARGVFSNEAGLGSAPIAHAAAKTDDPVRQGSVAMLGTFIDTIIVCSITGLAIITTGVWTSGETGVDLTAMAFSAQLPFGEYAVTIALVIFAFTTILGWSYYGEKCWQFIFGTGQIVTYRVIWVLAVFLGPWALTWEGGAKRSIDLVWLLADTLNAMMALPNLIALVLLSPVVVRLTKEYYAKRTRR